MFNLGFTEILLLGVIALIFIGPSQLPEVARTIGRLLNEWKRATSDFQDTFTEKIQTEFKERRSEAAEEDSVVENSIEPNIAPADEPAPAPQAAEVDAEPSLKPESET